MGEINLEAHIKALPFELQNKIFHYSILHPTAKIMKELIKEIDEINNIHFCIDTLKYTKLSFLNIIIINRYLRGYADYDIFLFIILTLDLKEEI